MAEHGPVRVGRHSAFAHGVALIFALALVAGCSGGKTPEVRPTSPAVGPSSAVSLSQPPPTTSPADLARQQATEAYLGMWSAMAEASHTSNWQSPDLARFASDAALQVISGSLYADHLNGVVTRGAPVDSPRVSSVDPTASPTTVLIADCGDDSGWVKYRADGSPLNDTPGGRRSITAEVRLHSDGRWRVTRFAVSDVGSC